MSEESPRVIPRKSITELNNLIPKFVNADGGCDLCKIKLVTIRHLLTSKHKKSLFQYIVRQKLDHQTTQDLVELCGLEHYYY